MDLQENDELTMNYRSCLLQLRELQGAPAENRISYDLHDLSTQSDIGFCLPKTIPLASTPKDNSLCFPFLIRGWRLGKRVRDEE